jgi:hypothetical protein
MESRRDRFRRQLARLAGTGNPREAIEAGLYVPRPKSSLRLARRIELQPKAIRVLTGPIGSGKSTELLVLADELNRLPDLWAMVIDVSLVHDLGDLREGTLVAAALIESSNALELSSDFTQGLHEFAYGAVRYRGNGFPEQFLEPGVLTPPRLKTSMSIDKLLQMVPTVVTNLKHRSPVLLFDSLDRVHDSSGFRTVLEKDAHVLVDHGFGVVLTAPPSTLWSDSGELRASTDTWDVLSYEDPVESSVAREFLLEVLRRRADPDLLPETVWLALVMASGGVLRDLIELARSAVEEAYLEGRDTVGPQDVEATIAHFARALALGMDGTAISTLRSVQTTRQVRAFDEPTLRLLKNRQILEHRDASGSYFEPHPALGSMLQRWAEAS